MNRIRTLGIREQATWVRTQFPSFRCNIEGGLLICHGKLQPGAVFDVYEVLIEYRTGRWPKAFVPGGQLRPREPGGEIPHTYGADQPCLFFPGGGEWRSDMKLALTVMPWLSLWLVFYEMWHATGEWLGGGISHGDVEEIEPAA